VVKDTGHPAELQRPPVEYVASSEVRSDDLNRTAEEAARAA